MKVAGVILLCTCLLPAHAQAADASVSSTTDGGPSVVDSKKSDGRSQPDVNLIAFVGRRIKARLVERKPKKNEIILDAEYFLKYEVLQVVFGSYSKKTIAFSSYVHIGPPAFLQHKYGLIYVSEHEGRLVQQKYLFQPVYLTADGRWAGCGDPYAPYGDMAGHEVKPELITFKPPVVFDIRDMPAFVIERKFPPPMFRRVEDTVNCEMGNYPEDLFRAMKEGHLKARGVFGSPRR
jgi:hypothetical protein